MNATIIKAIILMRGGRKKKKKKKETSIFHCFYNYS